MTRHVFLKGFFSILFLIFISSFTFGEIIEDKDFGFILDIPEGYNVDNYTEDGMSYIFSHPNIPVTFAIKISIEEKNNSSKNVLATSMKKLSAKNTIDTINWSGSLCSISNFSMTLDQNYSGWAVCAPVSIENSYLTLICYCPTDKFDACQQFIISTLNSLCIDKDRFNEPGIITSFAYPSEGNKQIISTINGKAIKSQMDKSAVDASSFVVDLEFSVFKLYANINHPMWKEAWQRYYRMVYRDSCGRLQNFSKDVYNSLYPVAKKENNSAPDITYAQYLLSWVQTFDYKRTTGKSSTDFTPAPAVLCGEGNDCDSRSMLIAIMLNSVGIETIMTISRDYSHALVATSIAAPGQTYSSSEKGKDYLFGETTAKVTWGMIAQDHADRSKWIPIYFDPEQ